MSLSGPQFGSLSAGPMGANSYVTPDGTQHQESHVAGPGFEQHEHSTFRHTINGQPAGGPAFPSMGGPMGGFGGGSSFHQSSAGGSSFHQGYHSGSAYGDMGTHSLAPPPPPAPSAFGSSFGASSAAGGAWSSHSQSRNSFDTGFHGHHGLDSMSHSGAMLPSPGMGGGLTGPQFGPLSTSGPSGVQEYFGADGSHHREVHQSGPGFEHHEHSSAKHTVNGQPVNATAPMGPPAGMGQIGSMMGGGSSFGGAYGGHSSTWGSAWEGGSSSFQRTSSF